jgi:hypothetical protein
LTTYYTPSGNPVISSRGVSSYVRAEFVLIQTGFTNVNADIVLRGLKAGDTWTGAHDFTGGTLTAATQTVGDASTKVATTAFVAATALSTALPGQLGNSGKALTTDGTNASWGAVGVVGGGTGFSSYTTGDILYASGAAALSKLAGVATGNALISGGVGVAPSWGKVGLTTHVSGALPAANGGTGVANNAANTITFTGAFALGVILTNTTSVQMPTSGTLSTLAGAENLQNKTLTNPDYNNSNATGLKVAGFFQEVDNGNSGASKTVTMSAGMKQKITLTAACALTLDWTGCATGNYLLHVLQNGTGGWALTYTSGLTSTRWAGTASAPQPLTAASSESLISMYYVSGAAPAVQSMTHIGAA